MTKPLSQKNLNFIKEHEQTLKTISECIKDTPIKETADLFEIAKNIAALKEDIMVGKPDDLPGLYHQLDQQYLAAKRFSKQERLPDHQAPYFGHLKIEENGKVRDIFLGHISYIPQGGAFRIVDWTKAPIASVYYNYSEGDEFELELPKKVITGLVIQKNILSIKNGRLLRIDNDQQSFVNTKDGWICLSAK